MLALKHCAKKEKLFFLKAEHPEVGAVKMGYVHKG